ncbi:MAG: PDZ domain-containing protein [Cyclobacteriaceae bacterium]
MKLKLLLCLQLIIQGGFCQPKMGYWLTSNVVRVPFEIINNSLFVEVTLNEYEGLSFIIDTGSNYSVVFTDSTLHLHTQNKSIDIMGFGNADSLSAYISIDNSVALKGLVTQGKQLLVIEKNKIGLQQFYDRPIHGVIGLDILRQFDTEINFSSNKLIFRNNGAKIKSGSRWKKVPFHLTENAIIIPSSLSTIKSKESIYLLLDTGSELPLLLQERFCPDQSVPTIIGMGILGYASGRIGRISKINIGEFEIDNIPAAFPDSASSRWNIALPQQGNLGIQFLKKHRTIINYTQGYMQLKPIRRLVHKPFQYNHSGIAISVDDQTECSFYISEVAPSSPAEQAGLLRGDKIILINQTMCSKLTLQKISEYFFDDEISELDITVMRDYTLKHIKVYIKDNLPLSDK